MKEALSVIERMAIRARKSRNRELARNLVRDIGVLADVAFDFSGLKTVPLGRNSSDSFGARNDELLRKQRERNGRKLTALLQEATNVLAAKRDTDAAYLSHHYWTLRKRLPPSTRDAEKVRRILARAKV